MNLMSLAVIAIMGAGQNLKCTIPYNDTVVIRSESMMDRVNTYTRDGYSVAESPSTTDRGWIVFSKNEKSITFPLKCVK